MSRGRGSVVIESKSRACTVDVFEVYHIPPEQPERGARHSRSNCGTILRRCQSLTLDQQTVICIHTDLLFMTNDTPLRRHLSGGSVVIASTLS